MKSNNLFPIHHLPLGESGIREAKKQRAKFRCQHDFKMTACRKSYEIVVQRVHKAYGE